MTKPDLTRREGRRELRDDRDIEARVLWKGLIALVVVIVVIWIRQTYLI